MSKEDIICLKLKCKYKDLKEFNVYQIDLIYDLVTVPQESLTDSEKEYAQTLAQSLAEMNKIKNIVV